MTRLVYRSRPGLCPLHPPRGVGRRCSRLEIVEGVRVEVELPLEWAVGQTSAPLEHRQRVVVESSPARWRPRGRPGDVPIAIVAGPDEYLFGEETGLLQVIEGDAPLPRLLPPYLHGLFATRTRDRVVGRPRADGRPRPPSTPARTRRWSTTSRRWPPSPTSWPGARSGTGRLGTAESPGRGRVHGRRRRGPTRRRRGRDGHPAPRA